MVLLKAIAIFQIPKYRSCNKLRSILFDPDILAIKDAQVCKKYLHKMVKLQVKIYKHCKNAGY